MFRYVTQVSRQVKVCWLEMANNNSSSVAACTLLHSIFTDEAEGNDDLSSTSPETITSHPLSSVNPAVEQLKLIITSLVM